MAPTFQPHIYIYLASSYVCVFLLIYFSIYILSPSARSATQHVLNSSAVALVKILKVGHVN